MKPGHALVGVVVAYSEFTINVLGSAVRLVPEERGDQSKAMTVMILALRSYWVAFRTYPGFAFGRNDQHAKETRVCISWLIHMTVVGPRNTGAIAWAGTCALRHLEKEKEAYSGGRVGYSVLAIVPIPPDAHRPNVSILAAGRDRVARG